MHEPLSPSMFKYGMLLYFQTLSTKISVELQISSLGNVS